MMKQIGYILAIFLLCMACKEDLLETYHGEDAVYFASDASEAVAKYADTTTFSFAFETVADTILKIPVTGLGEVTDYDRKFKVIVEGGNAAAGVNYEPLEEEYVLEAGEIRSYIPVHIYREGAKDTVLAIDLRLVANEYFSQNIPFKKVKYDTVDITRHVVVFTNNISKPKMWTDGMLGYFSEAKFVLLNRELDIKPADWFDDSKRAEIGPKAMGAGVYMVNYLNIFVNNNDYVNMPKDPDAPAANRGYMTFRSMAGDDVKIPASWPDAANVK